MKKFAIPFFLVGSLAMMYIMSETGATLKTTDTPHGILDLEFAYNTTKTNTVINAWAPNNSIDNIAAATRNTWLDFIFLFFYSIFLYLSAQKLSRLFGGSFGRAGKFIAAGALLAGFLDILENSGMLLTLSGHGAAAISACTSFFSIIKWGLAILAILYVITGVVGLLRARLIR